ncbi:hypothetical protein FOA52_013914 [Chlamydomonas sp. UWO 241]|nr:hypothetical protein FOA52_013914 [Chlamydomonas sp. UWO 241]
MQMQRKCVYEEIKKGNIVVGEFSARRKDNDAEQYVDIRVDDPYGSSLYEQTSVAEGTFAFTAVATGEFKVCFTSRELADAINTLLKLDWKIGVAATDWASIAKKEHLDTLTVELRRIEDGIREVYQDMLELQRREQEMRDVSESTNQRVAWYSVYALLACIVSGLWQVWYLRRFFQRKKLL